MNVNEDELLRQVNSITDFLKKEVKMKIYCKILFLKSTVNVLYFYVYQGMKTFADKWADAPTEPMFSSLCTVIISSKGYIQ